MAFRLTFTPAPAARFVENAVRDLVMSAIAVALDPDLPDLEELAMRGYIRIPMTAHGEENTPEDEPRFDELGFVVDLITRFRSDNEAGKSVSVRVIASVRMLLFDPDEFEKSIVVALQEAREYAERGASGVYVPPQSAFDFPIAPDDILQ